MSGMRRPLIVATAALLAMFLYVANFAWWLDTQVLDRDQFVATSVDVLGMQTSRDATAKIIIGKLVEEVPLLRVIDTALIGVFSDLLATEQLEGLLEVLGVEVHERLVTGDQSAIVIDLEPYRDTLLAPLEAISPELVSLVPEGWFRSVTVLEESTVPNLEPYARRTVSVFVVALVIAALLGVATVALTRRWITSLVAIGGAFVVAGGLSVFLVPAVRSATVSRFSSQSLGVVVLNLNNELARTLVARSWLLAFVGFTMVGIGLILWANQTPGPEA